MLSPEFVLIVGIWIYGIVDAAVADPATVRNLPKWAWLLLIGLFPPLGAIVWFFLGRPRGAARPRPEFRTSRPAAPRRPRPPRAERVDDEAEVRARIAERDRLLAEWAEEDRRKAEEQRSGEKN
jgi:hypothetical protein